MAKTLKRRYRGLQFNYRINSNKQNPYKDKYMEIEDFIAAEFPKNHNPISAREHTKIFNISWNSKKLEIEDEAIDVAGLKKLILSVKNEDGTYDMDRLIKELHNKARE